MTNIIETEIPAMCDRPLTMENWKEKFHWQFGPDWDRDLDPDIDIFIDQLLDLQKQALKDEAVKRIEEISTKNPRWKTALIKSQDIIRNL